jgi:hypothetical protein
MATVRVEMTFPPELKDEPIVYRMVKEFEVVPKIIEASFSASRGWAYLNLEGEEDEIERLFAYLRDVGVIIDVRV